MPTVYECRICKFHRPTKRGMCPNCGRWGNTREIRGDDERDDDFSDEGVVSFAQAVKEARNSPEARRLLSGMAGFDYVLGGGIVPGVLILFSGDPGVGKSTLLLDVLRGLAGTGERVLYVTGEESTKRLALRAADRMRGRWPKGMYISEKADIDDILDNIDDAKPSVVVVDSLQAVKIDDEITPGSAKAVAMAVDELRKVAHADRGPAIIAVCQVNKGGDMAGPKYAEHMADTSLHFGGNPDTPARLLKINGKNRDGASWLRCEFEMTEGGVVDLYDKPKPEPIAPESAEPAADPEPPPVGLHTVPRLRALPADADRILETDCEHEDCRGQAGRACTAASGEREVGFHESRIAAARMKAPRPEGGK